MPPTPKKLLWSWTSDCGGCRVWVLTDAFAPSNTGNNETESFSGLKGMGPEPVAILYIHRLCRKVEDFHPDERGIAAGERPNPVSGDVSVPRAGSKRCTHHEDGHDGDSASGQHGAHASVVGDKILTRRRTRTVENGPCRSGIGGAPWGQRWLGCEEIRDQRRLQAVGIDEILDGGRRGPLRIPGSEVVSHRAGAGGNQTYEKPMEGRGRRETRTHSRACPARVRVTTGGHSWRQPRRLVVGQRGPHWNQNQRRPEEGGETYQVIESFKETYAGDAPPSPPPLPLDIDEDEAPATRSPGVIGRKNEQKWCIPTRPCSTRRGPCSSIFASECGQDFGGAGLCPDARRMGHKTHAGRRTKAVNHEFRDSVTGGSNLVVSAIQQIYREVGASHSWGTRERPRMRLGVEQVAFSGCRTKPLLYSFTQSTPLSTECCLHDSNFFPPLFLVTFMSSRATRTMHGLKFKEHDSGVVEIIDSDDDGQLALVAEAGAEWMPSLQLAVSTADEFSVRLREIQRDAAVYERSVKKQLTRRKSECERLAKKKSEKDTELRVTKNRNILLSLRNDELLLDAERRSQELIDVKKILTEKNKQVEKRCLFEHFSEQLLSTSVLLCSVLNRFSSSSESQQESFQLEPVLTRPIRNRKLEDNIERFVRDGVADTSGQLAERSSEPYERFAGYSRRW
ncbi:hypothetical protein C8R46DRAFT_1042148 [Mycena filopes]|nr:hypothetical protein C8R46DRAFT_1042148 [Mycena filopes]